MSRTVVHLLRHGEVFNPEGILYGRLPGYRLSEAGEQMAHVAGQWFRARGVAAVYSSPLERARQTAAALEAALELTATIEPRAIESENAFEGTKFGVGDGVLRRPRNWVLLRNPFRPSWGEPYAQVAARMLAAVADIRAAHPGAESVLVSHQLPIVCARRSADGMRLWHRPDRRRCSLASVTSLVFDGDRLTHTEYAEPAASVPRSQSHTVGA